MQSESVACDEQIHSSTMGFNPRSPLIHAFVSKPRFAFFVFPNRVGSISQVASVINYTDILNPFRIRDMCGTYKLILCTQPLSGSAS
ncbi:hypothetical protein Bca52824_024035 [Brassica carinata]|uniref:Uncharacterized protein n=1 Tax=Brassica carinata TaxID=52824 RepID=A0A8X7VJV7_BRACI|nr:hypothetical protein Bca52824_024035 [Brassica carinata]